MDSSDHFMRLSSSVYGGLLINSVFFKESKLSAAEMVAAKRTDAVIKSLKDHCNVDPEDVFFVDCKNTEIERAFHPGVAIILDHVSQSVVVILRGTITWQDALTDLVAHKEAFAEGFAHSGMLASAKNTMAKILPYLCNLRERYTNYPVKIVGHSLGAGLWTALGND